MSEICLKSEMIKWYCTDISSFSSEICLGLVMNPTGKFYFLQNNHDLLFHATCKEIKSPPATGLSFSLLIILLLLFSSVLRLFSGALFYIFMTIANVRVITGIILLRNRDNASAKRCANLHRTWKALYTWCFIQITDKIHLFF